MTTMPTENKLIAIYKEKLKRKDIIIADLQKKLKEPKKISLEGKKLLTTIEAAFYLGMKPKTLREKRKSMNVPYRRVMEGQRGIRFDIADLDLWVKNQSDSDND